MTIRTQVPTWVQSVTGLGTLSYIHETSEVDLRSQTFTLRSTNLDWVNLFSVEETCTYTPDPEDPANKTHYKQEFVVRAFPYGVRDILEKATISRVSSNAGGGLKILNSICETLQAEAKEKQSGSTDGSSA